MNIYGLYSKTYENNLKANKFILHNSFIFTSIIKRNKIHIIINYLPFDIDDETAGGDVICLGLNFDSKTILLCSWNEPVASSFL